MKLTEFSIDLLFVASMCLMALSDADAALTPSADGMTVYDDVMHVTWLANANLAGTPGGQFGVSNINMDGSMNYATAVMWVAALNAYNGGAGFLGHNNWTFPTTPLNDSTCTLTGPNGTFGFPCTGSYCWLARHSYSRFLQLRAWRTISHCAYTPIRGSAHTCIR